LQMLLTLFSLDDDDEGVGLSGGETTELACLLASDMSSSRLPGTTPSSPERRKGSFCVTIANNAVVTKRDFAALISNVALEWGFRAGVCNQAALPGQMHKTRLVHAGS